MPEILKKLADLIAFLPGIGDKTAVKLAFFLLKSNTGYLDSLASTIAELKSTVAECTVCGSLTDRDHAECSICRDHTRATGTLCIVEDYLDLVAIERLGVHHGQYHVLGGVISPLSGKSPADLRFRSLFERVESENISELILALNPNIEGEATALYIEEYIPRKSVHISRLSKGLPNAGFIEYADEITLLSAFKGRK